MPHGRPSQGPALTPANTALDRCRQDGGGLQRERQSGDYDPYPLIEEAGAREVVMQAEGVLRAIRLLLAEAAGPVP